MTCPISLGIKPVPQGTFQKEGQEVSAVAAQRNWLDVFSHYGYRNENLEGSVILHSFSKMREIASSFSTYEILNHVFFFFWLFLHYQACVSSSGPGPCFYIFSNYSLLYKIYLFVNIAENM